MIKNYSLPALLLLISLSLHIVSCENISTTEDITSKARLYFEENATNLVLPDLSGNPLSKSEQLDEIFNNVYISWDKAKTVSTDSSIVTEAPIVSLEKTLVTLNESHGEHIHAHKAICSSYLVIEDMNFCVKMNIVTIIEKGTSHNIRYSSNKENFNGFIFISDLDGNIIETNSYIDGNKYIVNTKLYCKDEINTNSKFIGFSTAKLVLAKSDDEEAEAWHGYVICSKCGYVYEADILLNRGCKFCGEEIYNGYEACPKCQKPLMDCTCFEGPYDGSDNNEKEEEDECCEYCGEPVDSCTGHSPQTCSVCKMPIDVCKCD